MAAVGADVVVLQRDVAGALLGERDDLARSGLALASE
jgi:hypothetical protein